MSVEQPGEVRILGQHDHVGLPRGFEDRRIGRVPKVQVSNGNGGQTELLGQPGRKRGGELGVQPDGHAATIG